MTFNWPVKPYAVTTTGMRACKVQCLDLNAFPSNVKAGSKLFGQLGADRCLRGFINMSGIGGPTIFKCLYVYKPQRTWKAARSLISTYPYFAHQVDIMINQAHTGARSVLSPKIRFKEQNCPRSFECEGESESLVKGKFCDAQSELLPLWCCFWLWD